MAIKNYKSALGIRFSDWVGLRYFTEFFQELRFYKVLRNTAANDVMILEFT